jgi:hypothetical protein
MRRATPASFSGALAAAWALSVAAAVLGAAPAQAAPEVHADPGNSAVVTRLSIGHGKGWLTMHTRSSSAIGFSVRVPAGSGSWNGPADVYVPEQGAHCLRKPGPDLLYECSSDFPTGLPTGAYAVSIPVTRIGSVEGLTGSAWASQEGVSDDFSQDTFPVLDASHYRSTSEVRAAYVTGDEAGAAGRATISLATTIVPGEDITALDSTLPSGSWRIIGSNVVNHGVRCSVVGSGTEAPSLHCRPDAASGSGFAPGRYNLALHLGGEGEQGTSSAVSLTACGHAPEPEDTFPWVTVTP